VLLASGVALASGQWLHLDAHLDGQSLIGARRTLVIIASALFFGAGLMQLSVWRVDRRMPRGQAGLAMVVFGMSATFLSGLGPLLHESAQATLLNPLAAALVATTTLAVVATTQDDVMRPGLLAPLWLWVVAMAFAALAAIRHVLGVSLDPSPALEMALELGVASMWFTAAVASAKQTGRQATWDDTGLLAALGCVWLMRAGAVLDPAAWGLASAVLLGLVSLVVLTTAMIEVGDAAESEHERVAAAEAALAAATRALTTYDRQRQDMRHGSRNAMAALRLATQVLAEHGEQLEPEARQQLRLALVDQVGELDVLLTQRVRPSHASSFARIPAQAVRS
jgi:hypothetical protein